MSTSGGVSRNRDRESICYRMVSLTPPFAPTGPVLPGWAVFDDAELDNNGNVDRWTDTNGNDLPNDAFVIVPCGGGGADREVVCWTTTAGGDTVFTGTIRHDDALPAPGWMLFDQHQTPVNPTEPGLTFVPCGGDGGPVERAVDVEYLPVCVNGDTSLLEIVERIYPPGGGPHVETRMYIDIDGNEVTLAPGDTVEFGQCLRVPELELVCGSVTGELQQLFRRIDTDGVETFEGANGVMVTPQSWTPGFCDPTHDDVDVETIILCDGGNLDANGNPTPFIRRAIFDVNTGAFVSGTEHSTSSPYGAYPVVGPVVNCNTGGGGGGGATNDDECLTDDNGVFFRRTSTDEDGVVTVSTVDVAGAAYVPVGTVEACGTMNARDVETLILCDSGTIVNGEPARFIRRMVFDAETGAFLSQTDTDMGGAAYNPTGPVIACPEAAAANVDQEVVCWTTTAGGSTVFTGTIRHEDGTGPFGWQLFDQHQNPVNPLEPGLTFVPCTPAAREVRSHMVNLLDGAAWNGAAPAGEVLTSVSMTVLSGDADVVDNDGTATPDLPPGFSASWQAEDPNTLAPPQSITSSNPGRVVLTVTTRLP